MIPTTNPSARAGEAHITLCHNHQLTIETDRGHFTFHRADGTSINPHPDTP